MSTSWLTIGATFHGHGDDASREECEEGRESDPDRRKRRSRRYPRMCG